MTNLQTTAKPLILDPSLLGRPVHRLPHFAAQLRDDMIAQLRQPAVRRYWGNVTVEGAAFSRLDGTEERVRWQHYAAGSGVLGFALERKVLLSVLNYRYGRGKESEGAVDEAAIRVTATEERLAVVLGQQMVAVVAQRIAANLPGGEPSAAAEEPVAVKGSYPPKGAWIITVDVRVGETEGKVWFTLDKNLMSDVLRGVWPERDTGKKTSKQSGPLAQRLQVALNGRLVSKEVTLGALFDLRVGDVIPVSLHRADVMLEDSRLFTAAVTEHKGKLCLTSFEDVE
jgi:flagellar motor switch protein FliM